MFSALTNCHIALVIQVTTLDEIQPAKLYCDNECFYKLMEVYYNANVRHHNNVQFGTEIAELLRTYNIKLLSFSTLLLLKYLILGTNYNDPSFVSKKHVERVTISFLRAYA